MGYMDVTKQPPIKINGQVLDEMEMCIFASSFVAHRHQHTRDGRAGDASWCYEMAKADVLAYRTAKR